MSEFSDSFHVRSNDPADAVALLRAAGVAGYVFAAANGWVSFLYSEGTLVGTRENYERITSANRDLLLHYSYAEDHGCYIEVFEGTERVARIKAPFEFEGPKFDRAEFVRLGLLDEKIATTVAAWVARAHIWQDRREGKDEYLVANALRLPRFRWFAYRYESRDDAESHNRIEVSADGRVVDKLEPASPGRKKAVAKKAVAKKKRTR